MFITSEVTIKSIRRCYVSQIVTRRMVVKYIVFAFLY